MGAFQEVTRAAPWNRSERSSPRKDGRLGISRAKLTCPQGTRRVSPMCT